MDFVILDYCKIYQMTTFNDLLASTHVNVRYQALAESVGRVFEVPFLSGPG